MSCGLFYGVSGREKVQDKEHLKPFLLASTASASERKRKLKCLRPGASMNYHKRLQLQGPSGRWAPPSLDFKVPEIPNQSSGRPPAVAPQPCQ